MKLTFKSLLALVAFGCASIVATAQSPKIMVVDLAQLYDTHYKTEEQNAKLRVDEQKAQEELEKLNAEGNRLVEQFRELEEQTNNPALSDSARATVQQNAQRKVEEIQRKQNEVESFRANTQRSLQQRITTFRDILLEEISKIATEVAKRQGATLLIDKSGPSLIGISNVIYNEPSLDITELVATEINRTRPAGSPAAARAPADAEPAVTFPGARRD